MMLTTTGTVHPLDDRPEHHQGWFDRRRLPCLTVAAGDAVLSRRKGAS
jgi:hypothetical protein